MHFSAVKKVKKKKRSDFDHLCVILTRYKVITSVRKPINSIGRFTKVRSDRPDHSWSRHFVHEIGFSQEFLLKKLLGKGGDFSRLVHISRSITFTVSRFAFSILFYSVIAKPKSLCDKCRMTTQDYIWVTFGRHCQGDYRRLQERCDMPTPCEDR